MRINFHDYYNVVTTSYLCANLLILINLWQILGYIFIPDSSKDVYKTPILVKHKSHQGSFHLVDTGNYGYVAHDGLELGERVDEEWDGAGDDGILGDSVEIVDREVEVVGDAIDQIDEQMVAVDGPDVDGDGI